MPTKRRRHPKRSQASISVIKLAAAQRQLDAAIRMTISGEDELAIHTLAAAAYQILRDIKRKRGRREFVDRLGLGLYLFAKDIAEGRLDDIPKEISEPPEVARTMEAIVSSIKSGEINSATDVVTQLRISKKREKDYWGKFNFAANFLKHADRDEESLGLDKLDNENLLLRTGAAYADVMGPGSFTPEMVALGIYYLGDDPTFLSSFEPEMREKIRLLSPAKRRRVCRLLLRGKSLMDIV